MESGEPVPTRRAVRPKDQAAYDAKLATLAATISAAAPDVLAVQEVGQPAALDDLVARLPGSWTITLSDHPDVRGIRVGFLTRTALATTSEVVNFPLPLRPVQVVDATADAATVMGRGGLHIHLEASTGGVRGSRRSSVKGPAAISRGLDAVR